MQDFEKLGSFYLGKVRDPSEDKDGDVLLYEAKNLTTHAVCIGMTGSGKTGLGIVMLEEAGIDSIPALIIDPKGDLGNLLLTFPHLSPEEFKPWIDEAEAKRAGLTLKAYAEQVADTWKEGLAKWGENKERIQKLRQSVDMAIYTPASQAGIPLSILGSFAAPSKELSYDTAAMRERVLSVTSSLLGLLGIAADPIKSKEHILIATLIDNAWKKGQDVDIPLLIQQVQKPPFDKIGALDVDTFFPPKERMALSISLNNLLASPGFAAWMQGEPLDITKLLYTDEGKPKLSIISIAHLTDPERMFFVTLLLNQLLVWVRKQPGTSSLRALLYMDEVFGFFPPVAMPPSKTPMLTLLKQARAYGLGIILATQNPVDLDYKGLANCGTWFIGKLQTDRDKSRVLEGLNTASNGELDSKKLNQLIAATKNRVFIMRSIHEKEPILFETRWSMSYLRGPMTLSQIAALTDKDQKAPTATSEAAKSPVAITKPLIPLSINELYMRLPTTRNPCYKPLLAGFGKLHFIDTKAKIDLWKDVAFAALPQNDGKSADWEEAQDISDDKSQLEKEPLSSSTYEEIPAGLMQEKNYAAYEKDFTTFLFQHYTLDIFRFAKLNLTSKENESEVDFRTRVGVALREQRDEIVKKINEKYQAKIATLSGKIRKAQDKVSQESQQAFWQKVTAFISLFTTLFSAFLSKKKVTQGTITQAGTSMRRIGKIGQEDQQAVYAENDVKSLQDQLNQLQQERGSEIALAAIDSDPSKIPLETLTLRPKKGDISVDKISLLWWPKT